MYDENGKLFYLPMILYPAGMTKPCGGGWGVVKVRASYEDGTISVTLDYVSSYAKVTVKVPKKKLKAYRSMLRAKGISKKAKITK